MTAYWKRSTDPVPEKLRSLIGKIPICRDFAGRIARRELRLRLQALRQTQRPDGDPWKGLRILTEVSKVPLVAKTDEILYGSHCTTAEIDARACTAVLKYALGSAIFWKLPLAISGGRAISLAAPDVWCEKFAAQGIKVDMPKSNIAWKMRQLRFIAYGFRVAKQYFEHAWKNRRFDLRPPYWIAERFPTQNFSADAHDHPSYQLPNYIVEHLGKNGPKGWVLVGQPNSTFHRASAEVVFSPLAFPPLTGTLNVLGFGVDCFKVIAISALRWIQGRVYAPALIQDALEIRYLRRLSDDRLPNWYISTHTGVGGRPLWVAETEARGVKTAIVYYSINNQPIQFAMDQTPPPVNPEHLLLNWKRYLVSDEFQKDWIKSVAQGDPEIIPLGNIPLQDNGRDLPDLPARTVSVFDIPVLRDSYFVLHGERKSIYSEKYVCQFLTDISESLENLGIHMALKAKRTRTGQISKFSSKQQLRLANKIIESGHCTNIDHEIAAQRLMQKTAASISIPFSSTAPSAANLGKPSIYYDPSGQLKVSGNQNHGVEVIRGRASLEEWLRKTFPMDSDAKMLATGKAAGPTSVV